MNISKPVFVGVILLGVITGLMVSQVIASGGHHRSNPLSRLWEAITELQSTVESLEERVETLEEQSLPQGLVSAPTYDSGWVLSAGNFKTFSHNLGTTRVFVYLIGKDYNGLIYHHHYGDDLMWGSLNSTHISVMGRYSAKYVRIMIWKISD